MLNLTHFFLNLNHERSAVHLSNFINFYLKLGKSSHQLTVTKIEY